ncbi:MAG: response regulator [Planctomycetes bacterium]|nr:response regulator [Planctomycetota bacterium]
MAQNNSHLDVLSVPTSLLDQSRDAVWRANAEGRLSYLNQTGEQLFGRSFQSLEKTPTWWSDVVHLDDHDSFIASLATELPSEVTVRIVRPDGTSVTVRQHVQHVTSAGTGTETLAIVMQADGATDSERALREAEASYHALIDSLPLCMLIKDRDGKRTLANRSYLELHEKTLEEVVGKTDKDLLPHELAEKYSRDDREVMRTGAILLGKEEYRTEGGKKLWIERIKCPLRDADGRITGIQLLFWDITEKRQAEEALDKERYLLQTLLETIPDAIYFKDRESRFLRISQSMAEKFGLKDPSEAIGKTDADIFTEEHAQQARADELAIMESGRPLVASVEKETWPDREDTWCSSTKMPLQNSSQETVGTFGISRDITDLKRAQDELREARDAADAANRAKSEFVANMSHEIRTPMNGIIGMAELLVDTSLTREQTDYLGMIRQSADSLLRLLNDILDFSKIEAGKLELETLPFNLSDCVGKTTQTLAVRGAEKGLELACRIAPELPERIIGDPGRVRQMIVNLVGNAIKFTEKGEVVVEVTEASRSNGNIRLHFAVKDTGVGIPPDKQQSVFEAFTQADASTTRRFGGTGLGLAISSQLVRMMKGEIWIESAVGKGTTFHFTSEFEIADDQPAPSSFERSSLAGLPVLVVDDNQTNRRILEEMLKSWSLAPKVTESGVEALTEMQRAANESEPYRLVLLDCMMPGMDGFSLAQLITGNIALAHPTIVMISSAARPGDARRCREIGISRYMTKPVIKSELLDAILEALDERGGESIIEEPITAIEPSGPALRVLLAEDGLVNQRVAVGFLERAGHHVTVAENGAVAIRCWEDQPFDVILMDVQMPIMDGLEATAVIRERESASGKRTPIIAMTAAAMKGDRERCLDVGMDDYVSKPIAPDAMFATMAKHVDRLTASDSATSVEPTIDPSGIVDFDTALDRVPGGLEVLQDLAKIFLMECPKLVKDLHQGLADENAEATQRAAHTLKGAARILCAGRLSVVAADLEHLAKDKHLEAVRLRFDEIEATVDQACKVIKAWRG